MITDIELKYNKQGLILNTPSSYKPSKKVIETTKMVTKHFNRGVTLRDKPYREFNDMSLISRMNEDQRSFNVWQEPESQDITEQWKSRAVKPIVRNKIISIAAHIARDVIYPKIFAQNENDQEDKDAASVMRNLMEWRNDDADYERTFLYSIIASLVNPAVIVHTEYSEVMRKIKEITGRDTWTEKEVVDEIFSGFRDSVVPLDELYIADFYTHDIQKQPFIIWRKAIDYTEAVTKYGDKENFQYVSPGLQCVFDEGTDTFYEEYDDELSDNLVEEVIYYNRNLDLQLTFVNGIIMCDPEYPNPRQDKRYPFAKTGYELIDEGHFFYYKSLAFKTAPDEEIVNTLYRMTIDGTYLQVVPPLAVYGGDDVDNPVMIPGASFPMGQDFKVESMSSNMNLNAGYNMLNLVEESINESSQSPRQAGQQVGGSDTAFEVAQLEKNAQVMLGLFGKMIGFLVKDLGDLFISDILQHMTVKQVTELSSGSSMLKFRNFLLNDKPQDGKRKSVEVRFNEELPEEMGEDEYIDRSYDVLEKEGGLEGDKQIFEVNPELFRRMKYLTVVYPDAVSPKNDNVQKALNLEAYDRAIANPLSDQEAVFKDLLLGSYDKTKDDVDKYVRKESPMSAMTGQQPPSRPAGSPVASVNQATKMAI